MPPRNNHVRGFSLVEAVIVIAIMAILASAATPMLMRSLTQQRTRQTRDLARSAYEALVGARDRTVPNLLTDVGFVPPAALADLRFLTTINPAAAYRNGAIPPQYPTVAAGFTWGWNGPYWTSPIQAQAGTNGIPADGWGRPFRWRANQVQSAGADGVFGTADDVVYPPAGVLPPSSVTLKIQLTRDLPTPVVAGSVPTATFSVQVIDRFQQQNPLRTQTPIPGTFTWPLGDSQPTGTVNVQPGAVFIQVTSSAGNQSQLINIAPGETSRVVAFRWNN